MSDHPRRESDGEIQNKAELVVSSDVAGKILKYNGMELYGRPLQIVEAIDHSNSAADGPVSTIASNLMTLAEAIQDLPQTSLVAPPVPPPEKPFVLIDMSVGFDCYAIRSVPKARLVHRIQQSFLSDDTMVLVGPRRQNDTVWTLETDKIHLYKDVPFIHDENGSRIASIKIITPRASTEPTGPSGPTFRAQDESSGWNDRDPHDLVITLVDANRDRFRHVSDNDITRRIVSLDVGQIKKSVRVQRQPDSSVPSGNKLVVLKNVIDKTKIPPFLEFADQRMQLRYKGKPYKCHFCGELHAPGTACALEAEVRQLEKERDERKASNKGHLPIKTVADSTMRYARQGALASDVDVMSGGTSGNILNAVDVDGDSKAAECVVVVAGSNELHRRMDLKEFAIILETTRERFLRLAKKKKNVLILPPPVAYSFDSLQQAKQECKNNMLREIDSVENITVMENPLIEYHEDEGLHPSPEQTAELLAHINTQCVELFGTPYMLPTATGTNVISKRPYAAVSSLYIFGCAACDSRSKNKWRNICEECAVKLEMEPYCSIADDILRRADEISYTEMPPLQTTTTDTSALVEMQSGGKNRGRSPMRTPPPAKKTNYTQVPPPPSKVKVLQT